MELIDIGAELVFPHSVEKRLSNMEITLVDSLGKRIKFLKAVVENLGLRT